MNPNTHRETLNDMSKRERHPRVLRAIAKNPNAHSYSLEQIALFAIKHQGTLNPDRIIETLHQRATGGEPHARAAMMRLSLNHPEHAGTHWSGQ